MCKEGLALLKGRMSMISFWGGTIMARKWMRMFQAHLRRKTRPFGPAENCYGQNMLMVVYNGDPDSSASVIYQSRAIHTVVRNRQLLIIFSSSLFVVYHGSMGLNEQGSNKSSSSSSSGGGGGGGE